MSHKGLRSWKFYDEYCFSRLAYTCGKVSLMLSDDLLAEAEANSGPFRFGGKKGDEHFFL